MRGEPRTRIASVVPVLIRTADGQFIDHEGGVEPDLLDSGEATDPTGRQYLRARWFDPTTGRFNRLDPFAGLAHDPQSLHKYLYTHADPIMGTDPSGEVLPLLVAAASFGFKAYAAYETGSNIFDLVHRIREGAAIRGLLLEMAADAAIGFTGGKAFQFALKGLGRVAKAISPLGHKPSGMHAAQNSFLYGSHIMRRLKKRGWSDGLVDDTISSPYAVRKSVNKHTGGNATAFFRRDGSYVVLDDSTGEIIQISDRYDPNWIPDSSIHNPYVR